MARYVISLTLSLTAFGFSSPGWSQQPSAPVGAVTGHVICGDTERPARFAQVTLFGVPAEVAPAPKSDAAPDSTKTRALITKAISQANWIQTQTDLEGNFSATGVAPGDYYVFASMPGYVEPNNVVQAAIDGGADLKRSIPGVPRIHVAAEHTAQAEVTVERGAAISGHVLWDDGAPVTRAYVTTVNTKAQEREIPHEFSMVGLRPGDASMTTTSGTSGSPGWSRATI